MVDPPGIAVALATSEAEASKALIAGTRRSNETLQSDIQASQEAIEASLAKLNKPPGKLGAEKLTPEEQRRGFIEAAREAGASEDEADFDSALKRIAKPQKPSAI